MLAVIFAGQLVRAAEQGIAALVLPAGPDHQPGVLDAARGEQHSLRRDAMSGAVGARHLEGDDTAAARVELEVDDAGFG